MHRGAAVDHPDGPPDGSIALPAIGGVDAAGATAGATTVTMAGKVVLKCHAVPPPAPGIFRDRHLHNHVKVAYSGMMPLSLFEVTLDTH